MNSTLEKLSEARSLISKKKMEREGIRGDKRFTYFTPEQVAKLVHDACEASGLVPLFSLEKDEHGYFGRLEIWGNEEGCETTIMRTDVPSIQGANAAQNMGGCYTYTQRYMLMSAFGIADNSMDPDSDEGSKEEPKEGPKKEPVASKSPVKIPETQKIWLTKEQFDKAMKSDILGIKATVNAFNGVDGIHYMDGVQMHNLMKALNKLQTQM